MDGIIVRYIDSSYKIAFSGDYRIPVFLGFADFFYRLSLEIKDFNFKLVVIISKVIAV